ncbi:MAG: endonuclease/exonuclease/phosphatase family protein [Candidatus Paceibacterota bacterium]|jgi:endonuclease/exonuclease/phosphatase family metal-dependent hydrolase
MKIKILSWNIWCGTYLEEVIKFLKTADADIIALQEVSEDKRGNIGDIIAKRLGYECVHVAEIDMPLKYLPGNKSDDERTIKLGNAILSKHKIVSSKVRRLIENKKRLIIGAKIKIGNNFLNFYNIHLQHTHQQQSDMQDLQAKNLLKILPKKNMIVMGDFNASSESDVIKKINRSLKNTEIDSNTPTWSVYREGCTGCLVDEIKYKLDYIFTSKDIKTSQFKVYKSKASDHLPVSVIINI